MRGAPLRLLIVASACACAQADEPDPVGGAPVASVYEPTTAQRVAILDALQSVFDALYTGDADLLRSVMDPAVTMHFSETTATGDTSFGSSTLEALAGRVESSEVPLIERMWDPVVRVNGSLATIWTPYDFYAGREFSHCGVDAATLLDTGDGWTIVSLSWTRLQPPACDSHPDGPPAQ